MFYGDTSLMSSLCQCIRRTVGVLVVSSALFSQCTLAQIAPAPESTSVTTSLPSVPQRGVSKQGLETFVAVGAMGQLTATRISDTNSLFETQSLSPSAGVFATFQQSFKPWLGYAINFGYTRATYRYTFAVPASSTSRTGESYIPNNIYETSISYIARKNLTDRMTAFGEAGGGAITFAAINRDIHFSPGFYLSISRANTYRPVGIAGFGIDYRLAHGLALRAEYRGLLGKYPDYGSGSTRPTTVISEPILSVTYSFGKHSKR